MKKFVFPFFVIFIYITLIITKIHSSSIGVYHQYFYGSKKDSNLVFGQPRGIRSDEWLVGTPKIISAYQAKFAPVNPYLGFGENYVVQGLPTYHWRSFFHPQYWLFFILPLEHGFSAMWWFLPVLMIIGAYFLCLILFKNIFYSVLIALIFFFTPFNQWWSYSLSSFLAYGSFILISWCFLINAKKVFFKIISIISLTYFSLCYAFIQYPPFQISVGWLIFFLGLAMFLEKRKELRKTDYYWIFGGLVFAAIVSFALLTRFYFEFKDIINIIQNTVYPGKRRVTGGLYSLLHFLNGFFNIQLLDDAKGVASFGNQSEASNFFMISFFALPVYLYVLVKKIVKKEKINLFFLLLFFYFVFSLLYLFFGIPSFLSKITFLTFVPSKRMLIGLGIVNYFLVFFYLLKEKVNKNLDYKVFALVISFFSFFINLYIGYYLKQNFPLFIQNNIKIFLISATSGLLTYTLLMQWQRTFLIILFLFSLVSTYRVNPLYKGLDPLINTQLAKTIRKIVKTDPKARWLNYSSIYLENYVLANGGKSLSGVYYYPQFNLMKVFDSKSKYKNIWNRYAHVNFFDNNFIIDNFILYGTDNYGINFKACNNYFNQLEDKDKYFIFNKLINYECLNLYDKSVSENFFIYAK